MYQYKIFGDPFHEISDDKINLKKIQLGMNLWAIFICNELIWASY